LISASVESAVNPSSLYEFSTSNVAPMAAAGFSKKSRRCCCSAAW
jgi:hypothetical protein